MSSLLSRIGLTLVSASTLVGALATNSFASQLQSQDVKPTVIAEVLLGEIALQRQLYEDAWFAFLDASRNAQNVELAEKAYRIGFVLKDKEKTDEARKVLDSLDKDNEHVLLEKALREGRDNNEKVASQFLSEAIKKSQDYAVLFDRFSAESESFPDKKIRYNLLSQIGKVVGDNALAERSLALAAKAAGLNDKGLAHILKASKLAPDNGQILLESADFEFESAPEKTKKRLNAFLKKHPNNFHVRIAYAKALARSDNKKGAFAQLKAVEETAPNDAQAFFLCGVVTQEMKEYDAASVYYHRYLHLASLDKEKRFLPDAAYVQLGVIAIHQKKWDDALSYFAKVEKGDKYIPARLKQVEILDKLGRVDEACAAITAIRTDKPEQKAEFTFLAGQMLVAAKRKPDAMKYYEAACELAPKNTDFLLRTAMVAEEIGWIEKAETFLRRYIVLRPNDPHGYNTLGYMWLDRGIRTKDAKPLIEKALTLSGGKDAAILDSMGWLKFREGKFKEAETWLRKALKLDSKEPEITLHLATVLLMEKRFSEAKALVNAVLKENPENPEALSLADQLKDATR